MCVWSDNTASKWSKCGKGRVWISTYSTQIEPSDWGQEGQLWEKNIWMFGLFATKTNSFLLKLLKRLLNLQTVVMLVLQLYARLQHYWSVHYAARAHVHTQKERYTHAHIYSHQSRCQHMGSRWKEECKQLMAKTIKYMRDKWGHKEEIGSQLQVRCRKSSV